MRRTAIRRYHLKLKRRKEIIVRIVLVALVVLFAAQLHAQDNPAESSPTATLEEVLVTGEQPGPGLWKVSSGDHTLWILGSYAPLPKKMTWKSSEVENVVAASQELLTSGTVDADIGFFKALTLLPSLIGIRNNPDGAKLREVVPPDLYKRWSVLKEKYIGRDNDAEKWRPIFAAQELYSKAIEKSGLVSGGIVWPIVQKTAKKNKLKITTPLIKVEIDKPRAVIKEFKKSQLADIDCFAKTIERLETDLDAMRARANAWAKGDVDALRRLTHVDQASACIAAVMNAQVVQERGYQELPARIQKEWVDAAAAALAQNRSTFAVLSIQEILRPDGYLAALRAKGYTIDEP
jgi:uncharacterized protein YbaP (TraB family)